MRCQSRKAIQLINFVYDDCFVDTWTPLSSCQNLNTFQQKLLLSSPAPWLCLISFSPLLSPKATTQLWLPALHGYDARVPSGGLGSGWMPSGNSEHIPAYQGSSEGLWHHNCDWHVSWLHGTHCHTDSEHVHFGDLRVPSSLGNLGESVFCTSWTNQCWYDHHMRLVIP